MPATKTSSRRKRVSSSKGVDSGQLGLGLDGPKRAPRPEIDIEKELALAHKELAQAGFQFTSMLATRRLSLTRIKAAVAQVKSCHDGLDKLLERLEASR